MSLDIYLEIDVDTGGKTLHSVELFANNYTHNVTPMWKLAGCYEALYKSDGKLAGEVLPELERGLKHMLRHPNEHKKLNPPNKWGNYIGAKRFLRECIAAFQLNPKAKIRVSA